MIPFGKGAEKQVVSTLDGAIDWKKTDRKAYTEAYDINKLKYKKGQKPTIFVLAAISVEDKGIILDEGTYVTMDTQSPDAAQGSKIHMSSNKVALKAFKLGVKDIIDGPAMQKDGCDHVADSVIDEIGDLQIIQEIGSQVLNHNSLTGNQAKN